MSIRFKTPNFDTSKPVEITTAGGKTVTAYPVGYSSVPTTPITFKKPNVDTSKPVELTRYDGSKVTAYPEGMLPSPSKTENPVYRSPYSERVTELLDAISGYKPFSYDVESDPLYKLYRNQYLREGRRAVEDTMGSFAGMTGGIPSSYAVTAAAQAGNYYNSQLNDRIPELYQLAYDRYRNDYDKLFDELNMYMTADDIAYGRHRDDVGDFKDDRDYRTNINMYSDELARDDRDYNFKVNTYNDEKAAKERAELLELIEAVGGIPSGSGTTGSLSGTATLPYPENTVNSGTVGNGIAGALPEPAYGNEVSSPGGTIKQPSAWTTAVLQNMQYGSDNYIAIIESLKSSGISDLDKASYIYSLTQNGLSDELAMRMFTDIGLNISDYTD